MEGSIKKSSAAARLTRGGIKLQTIANIDSYNLPIFMKNEDTKDTPIVPFEFTGPVKPSVLAILENTIDQIRILFAMKNWPKCEAVLEYRTLEENFGKFKSDNSINLETKDVDIKNILLFQDTCAFIEKALSVAFCNIQQCGLIDKFDKIIEDYIKSLTESNNLITDTMARKSEIVQLEELIRNEKLKFKNEIQGMISEIGRLKDEIEDFKQESKSKIRYVEMWENSRNEQTLFYCNDLENNIKSSIEAVRTNFNKESRVHEELLQYLEEAKKDLIHEKSYWQEKYDIDMENIDIEIRQHKIKLSEVQTQKEESIKLYEQREQEMSAFNEYKEIKRQQMLEEGRKQKSATLLQAWWRGVMVRKGFGRYRKRDKKGKKKGSDKKKPKS